MNLVSARRLIARSVKRSIVSVVACLVRARRGHATVDEYLIAKGVDEAGRKRWSSAFGRKAAKVAREAGGVLRDTHIDWRGRVRRVFAYGDTSYLDTAWVAYEAKITEG